jgi:hypothetical protein
MAELEPFRFFDLPTDIRLMVYECITVKTTHIPLGDVADPKLVQYTLPGIAILATCQQIRTEAQPFLNRKLATIKDIPMRIETNPHDVRSLPIFLENFWPKDPSKLDIKIVRALEREERHIYSDHETTNPYEQIHYGWVAVNQDGKFNVEECLNVSELDGNHGAFPNEDETTLRDVEPARSSKESSI